MAVLLLRVVNGGTTLILPLLVASLLALHPVLSGQFGSKVSLVEVYASVTDRSGQPLLDPTAADFLVAEEDIPQTVTTFAAGEFPLSVAIALDRSFSMVGAPLTLARNAARALIASLNPTDEVMVLAICSGMSLHARCRPARSGGRFRRPSIDLTRAREPVTDTSRGDDAPA